MELGHVGLGLGLIGALSLPGLLVTDFYDLAIGANLPIDQAVEVADASQSYGWAIALGGPTSLGVFVGMLLLLIAGWRAGFISWWPGRPLRRSGDGRAGRLRERRHLGARADLPARRGAAGAEDDGVGDPGAG